MKSTHAYQTSTPSKPTRRLGALLIASLCAAGVLTAHASPAQATERLLLDAGVIENVWIVTGPDYDTVPVLTTRNFEGQPKASYYYPGHFDPGVWGASETADSG